jgi:alanine racemase
MHNCETEKTWVEIDGGRLRTNLQLLQQAIGPERAIILIVKSDAYGHGAETVTRVAAQEGVKHFGVAAVSEGVALRRAGVSGEIILLHPPLPFEVDDALSARLSPTISSLETARMIDTHAGPQSAGVHVEVNTGVNRLGLDWESAVETITRIAALPHIRIEGLFTHFRATDSKDSASLQTQLERFEQIVTELRRSGIKIGLCHAASSHAVTYFPASYCDGVRPGMMVYGGFNGTAGQSSPDAHTDERTPEPLTRMRPVMSVYARVLHTRKVSAGEWIHYGEMYRAERDMQVAVIPIGYGMGYSRTLSNNADVLIHGRRAPVVGAVGMDMTMVAIDDLPPVAVGDRVTIMGTDGDETISATELAQHTGTIPYEIVCRLGNSLPRRTVGETAPQIRKKSAKPLSVS